MRSASAGTGPPPISRASHITNLVKRVAYERDIAPVAADEGLAVVPYFALASGFLTGKYRTREDLKNTSREYMAAGYLSDAGLAVVDVLRGIADARDVEPATVALAWLRQRPHIVAPIASARTAAQLPALMASAQLNLDPQEVGRLGEVSSRVPE